MRYPPTAVWLPIHPNGKFGASRFQGRFDNLRDLMPVRKRPYSTPRTPWNPAGFWRLFAFELRRGYAARVHPLLVRRNHGLQFNWGQNLSAGHPRLRGDSPEKDFFVLRRMTDSRSTSTSRRLFFARVSNLIQTPTRNRLRFTNTGRFKSPNLRAPDDPSRL